MENELLDMYCNYAIVVRLQYKQISDIKEFFEDNGIREIYDRASLGRIYLKEETPPSVNNDGGNFDNK